jgi:aldehyde dehydrogenase (NAD+)
MFIDGELVDAASGATFENVNPATEEVIGHTADGGPEDMERAIAAARRAFDESEWPTRRELRIECLRQLRAALLDEKEALRQQTVAEGGCPLQLTYGPQGDTVIDGIEWSIENLESYSFERDLGVHRFFGIASRRMVWQEPIGVVGAITPWNFPLQVNLAKSIPALAAGCTVVLKPAPDTPWNATFLGRIVAERTDMPPGVFNVVTSSHPARVGELLARDARVDLVSFTGSTEVGRSIMSAAAGNIKKVCLELGGKSANIVLDDADFAQVLPGAVTVCVHAGQGCALTTRLLLPRSRYAEGVEILKAAFEGLAYGDPKDPANLMGPVINRRQYERVLGYIERGVAEGAKLLVGGRPAAQFERGFFIEPTLFVDVDPAMTIAREEIFGPVLSVIAYDDDDDAVRIANDSSYGLSGAVSSGSLERALAVARRIRTGTLSVNGGLWFSPDAPFGGYKQSGIGREMGLEGFEEYLETKTLAVPAQ